MKTNLPIPPKLARKLLDHFLRDDLVEEVNGDLEENYYNTLKTRSVFRAKLNYWYQVIHYIRPFAFRKSRTTHTNPTGMIRHNITITLRNFKRYKSSFFINLIGLSTGLASVLLIYLWVNDELTMDKFHEKDSRLYQVMRSGKEGGNEYHTTENNSDLLAPAMIEEVAELEHVVPVAGPFNHGILTVGGKSIKATDTFAGKDFFSVFSYQLLEGNKDQVLSGKSAMVISDELSLKLFGTLENVIGKSIVWNADEYADTYYVTGIYRKPEHSSQSFDFLLTIDRFLFQRPPGYINWGSNSSRVYVVAREGVDAGQLSDKVNSFYRSKVKPVFGKENEQYIGTMFLARYSDRYLHGRYENGVSAGGRIDYVLLFSTIGLFILLIACINFMNLSTARASRRMKEIGIKKSMGALRQSLVFQHLSESMVMTFLSLVVALLLAFLLLPSFNTMTGKDLELPLTLNFVLSALAIALVTGLIAGSYPSLYLSGFQPAAVLKGKLNTSFGEVWARKGLVIFQFCLSILLIVSMVVVYRQIDFVQSKNLGYDKDNVIVFEKEGKLNTALETFLTEAKMIPGVKSAAGMGYEMGRASTMTGGVQWEGKKPDDQTEFGILEVGPGLIETLGFKLTGGRAFSTEFATEKSKLVCNESAARTIGLVDPVGKPVKLWGQEYEIIGVVKDFYFESLYQPLRPCFFKLSDNNHSVLIKIEAGKEKETLAKLEKLYHQFNPDLSFDFNFLDDAYRALYQSEQRVSDLSMFFAGIAIVISCLGLFGLATFTAERRTKEIGIRKILGSSEFGIVYLLTSDFTKMVLIAATIALPLSYFLAGEWLGSFAYRIGLEWWYFAGAGLAALFVAWMTVGMQAVRAATINPTECLRTE